MLPSSLQFGAATSDRVTIGKGTGLDNLAAFSWLLWVYPTTLTNLRNFMAKDNGAAGFNLFSFSGTTGDIEFQVKWSTGQAFVRSNTTPLSLTNTWYYVAGTYDAAASQRCHMYVGTLLNPATEPTYSVNTNGSGAQADDSAQNLLIGNDGGASPVLAFQGSIAIASSWNTALSLNDVGRWQYNPYVTNRTIGHWVMGANGTGGVIDHSGHNWHGTRTGAIPNNLVLPRVGRGVRP